MWGGVFSDQDYITSAEYFTSTESSTVVSKGKPKPKKEKKKTENTEKVEPTPETEQNNVSTKAAKKPSTGKASKPKTREPVEKLCI